MRRFAACTLLVAALFAGATTMARAGTTGVLSGQVFASSGEPLRGATVELAQLPDPSAMVRDVDFQRLVIDTRSTDAHGFFVFLSVDPGFYVVRVVLPGWQSICPPREFVFADQTNFVSLFMINGQGAVDCLPINYVGPV
ncbi:MAG TPA: carboxypeptidase-like regulatory domain-containing protein [Candidatus Eremiobacteraceae bacterium]|nr:carboxypeptidase-like regulatory domain-containing protein [Candidatus Eremiobacteraceae bacterium]